MATLLVPSLLYSTIAEAMAAAQPGDTIEVAAGYGPEVVTVTAWIQVASATRGLKA